MPSCWYCGSWAILEQPAEQRLKIFITVEPDDDAASLARPFETHLGAERALQTVLQVGEEGVGGVLWCGLVLRPFMCLRRGSQPAHEFFGLADGEVVGDHLLPGVQAALVIGKAEQRAGVALADLAGGEAGADRLGEALQAERVGDGRPALAHPL